MESTTLPGGVVEVVENPVEIRQSRATGLEFDARTMTSTGSNEAKQLVHAVASTDRR